MNNFFYNAGYDLGGVQKPFAHHGGPADGSNVCDAPFSLSPRGINGGYDYTRLTYSRRAVAARRPCFHVNIMRASRGVS